MVAVSSANESPDNPSSRPKTRTPGTEPEGPLAGLLVADFSRVLAGPFATMMLADLGARVVKVERPGSGDDSRGYGPFLADRSLYFARVNRGKQSVALDLKDEADLAVARRLAIAADVVVENFRPGVMDRLGLGDDDLRPDNPGLATTPGATGRSWPTARCTSPGSTGASSRWRWT